MSKLFITILLALTCYSVFSQSKISNDTLIFGDKRIIIGDTIQLGYGSSSNKDFVFVLFGSGLAGQSPLPGVYNKLNVVVNKIYTPAIGKNIIRASPISKGGKSMKIFIEVDAAIDNKELIL